MIPKDTIDRIFEEARIEEVVGDFVVLKKRGVNLLGCCPFHNEKTPSFTVSPAKGIYKCFGCGKAGNSVNFVMDHEQMTYPEALKFLAKKYNIEIIEEEVSDEEKEKMNERESMFLVTAFAEEHFKDMLLNTDEGKSVGLSYFKSRGISDEMIEKFGLGYSFEERNHFSKIAIDKGYKLEFLEKTGLTINKGDYQFDRFAGRVMFPIQNLSGRVIGFGGRTLSTEKKIAKYLNSPESEIYHKSKTLYGIYQAKRSIIQHDNCFLVEGYTDVISFHQRGIENVVASSGTSLTTDQIKLIYRFTKNITVLYDGDAAGIKASFRGIDMILQEGMNIKVVLFPDGEDPDSFARKNNASELEEFLDENAQDFINFKISVLIDDAGDDPIKKAELIKDVVNSIALIPDAIIRSVYTKEAAKLLDIPEQTLINEQNKVRSNTQKKKLKSPPNQSKDTFEPADFTLSPENIPPPPDMPLPPEFQELVKKESTTTKSDKGKDFVHEIELIRILLQYGHFDLEFELSEEELEKINARKKEQEAIEEKPEEESKEVALSVDDLIEMTKVEQEEKKKNDESANKQKTEEGTIEEEEDLTITEDGKLIISVAEYILSDLKHEELAFSEEINQEILNEFFSCFEDGEIPTAKYFSQSSNPKLVERVIEITNLPHKLDDWTKHNIFVTNEADKIKLATIIHLNRFKYAKIQSEIKAIEEELSIEGRETDVDVLLDRMNMLNKAKKAFADNLGRNI